MTNNSNFDNKSIFPSIIIPAYNEEKNIPIILKILENILCKFACYEIIIIDDGSYDATLDVVKKVALKNQSIKYISFAQNYGHQKALRAGIDHASGDFVICMDADLQHPPELVTKMIERWKQGHKLILTKRLDYDNKSFFKRITSKAFYWLINLISDSKIEPGSADFRLMDYDVIKILKEHKETNIFYRGIILSLGYKPNYLVYQPKTRLYGNTSYTFAKMLKLAFDGIINTSLRPLRLATYLAGITGFLSIVYLFYALYVYFIEKTAITGWASIVLLITLFATLQFIILGIIGEYIGQVLSEVRHRPTYNIKETNIKGTTTYK